MSAAHQIIGLIESAPEIPKKRDYYREVDRFVCEIRNEFETSYGSESLAKLVLLKVSNLLVSYHACYHGHTRLVAHPTQILLDPANTCQLQCPGCVHSASYQGDWPKGIMELNLCDSILREYGYFALAAELYNYGEPLINPHFPEIVRRAKRMGLYTVTSSNLSLRFDVEAVVQSGLDSLLMSVDGSSQETLGIYTAAAHDSSFAWKTCEPWLRPSDGRADEPRNWSGGFLHLSITVMKYLRRSQSQKRLASTPLLSSPHAM